MNKGKGGTSDNKPGILEPWPISVPDVKLPDKPSPKSNDSWANYAEPAAAVSFELKRDEKRLNEFTKLGPFSLGPSDKLKMEELEEKYMGCLLGAAVGDAYGAPYEKLKPFKIKSVLLGRKLLRGPLEKCRYNCSR